MRIEIYLCNYMKHIFFKFLILSSNFCISGMLGEPLCKMYKYTSVLYVRWVVVYWHSTESNPASPTAQSKLKFFKWIYPPRIWHWSKIHCPNTEYPHKYTVPILSIHIKTEPVTAGEDAICTCICPLSSFVYLLVHYTQYTVLCISGPETSQIPLRLLLLWPAWVFMRRFRFF